MASTSESSSLASLASMTWHDVLGASCFVINMDACPDRMKITEERVRAAGYKSVERISAIDARTCDLKEEWARVGSPAFASHANARDFVAYPGTQCCLLSWMKVLDHIVSSSNDIPFATVFEDDVLFHKDFATLAPQFWEHTPKDFHMCYLGAQIDGPHHVAEISRAPPFCTHAIMFTKEGARMVRDFILKSPGGVYTIDCMIKDAAERQTTPFNFYVWNAIRFEDANRVMPKDWTKRNSGLVFQDYDLGTFVREW